MKPGYLHAVFLAVVAISTPVAAQFNFTPLPGAAPTLERQGSPPGACVLRVIVPMDRNDPATTISASVTAHLRQRSHLRSIALGTARASDAGDDMVFIFNRPADTCNQPVRAELAVTCTARGANVGASFSSDYSFPSAAGFSILSEVNIPRAC